MIEFVKPGKIPIAIHVPLLAFVLVVVEMVVRYLFDITGFGNQERFVTWDLFEYHVQMILMTTVVTFVKKGWVYFFLILLLEYLVYIRLTENKTLSLMATVLSFLLLIVWDTLFYGSTISFIKDAVACYLVVAMLFFSLKLTLFSTGKAEKQK